MSDVGDGHDAPDTVTEAVKLLEGRGYTDSMSLGQGVIRCAGCTVDQKVEDVVVDQVFRFEGPSNPDDEAIVLAVRCPACETRGVIVSAYGPGADPEVLDSLVMLERRFSHDGTPGN